MAAAGIFCEGMRLAAVMEQRRPAQYRLRRTGRNGFQRVDVDIVIMVRVALIEAVHRFKLRQNREEDIRKIRQDALCPDAAEQLCQLGVDALRGDVMQKRFLRMYGICGVRFDRKIQHRRKPHCTENAQAVFIKAILRAADTADDLCL